MPDKTESKEMMYKVKVIATGEKMSLVEYHEAEEPIRVSIPTKEIKDGEVKGSILYKGQAYGLAFEEIPFHVPTLKEIAIALHNHDVWTEEDVYTKPLQVRAAFTHVEGPLLVALMDYLASLKGK